MSKGQDTNGGQSLRDLAEEYNTNKPTINARIKKLEQVLNKPLTTKQDNIIYITEHGKRLLDDDIKTNPIKPKKKRQKSNQTKTPTIKQTKQAPKEPEKDSQSDYLNEYIELLKENLNRLEEQLKAKDLQLARQNELIESLNANIQALNKTLSESHTLLSREQDLKAAALPMPEPEPMPPRQSRNGNKRNFLSKLLIAGKVIKGDYD